MISSIDYKLYKGDIMNYKYLIIGTIYLFILLYQYKKYRDKALISNFLLASVTILLHFEQIGINIRPICFLLLTISSFYSLKYINRGKLYLINLLVIFSVEMSFIKDINPQICSVICYLICLFQIYYLFTIKKKVKDNK